MVFRSIKNLAKTTQLVLIISDGDEDTLKVTVMPKAAKDCENPALSTPLQLVGTPEELDEKFAEILGGYTASRTSLEDSLAASQTVMEAAKKEATEKAAKAASGKTTHQAARTALSEATPVSNEGNRDGDAEETPAEEANPDLDLFS